MVGYKIYYGVASLTYTDVIDAGNVTSLTIPGLVPGVTYYFAATSYDSLGQESVFSPEVDYSVPTVPPIVQIRTAPAGQFILTMSGVTGQTFDIQATQDFKTWTVIGTETLDSIGSLDFMDTNAANFSQRFYRIQEVP